MPTGDTYSSGHLVMSHFGTCMCSNVETNLSWTCLVSGPLKFEHPSVLLFCSLKSFLRKFYCRNGDLTKQYEIPLSRMLHTILDDDHIQWHPPLISHYTSLWPLLIWTLLPNLTFNLIVQGIHRTYATGAACHQRKLTPPDTWSCATLGNAFVLMLRLFFRPFGPWISNIPRDFCFAYEHKLYCVGTVIP